MKYLWTFIVILGLAVNGQAQVMQHHPAPAQSTPNNTVPVVLIASAVVTTGLILFKVRQSKKARQARFNVFQSAMGTRK